MFLDRFPKNCPRRMRPVDPDGTQTIPIEGDPHGRKVVVRPLWRIAKGTGMHQCGVNEVIRKARGKGENFIHVGNSRCEGCLEDFDYRSEAPKSP